MAKTILILGASRGIGLGLVQEFLGRGWKVVASERSESADLHAIDNPDLRIVTADVTATPISACRTANSMR